jgi:hypothetical protein
MDTGVVNAMHANDTDGPSVLWGRSGRYGRIYNAISKASSREETHEMALTRLTSPSFTYQGEECAYAARRVIATGGATRYGGDCLLGRPPRKAGMEGL